MQKIIRTPDPNNKDIVQITTADERWYIFPDKDKDGIPIIKEVPSVTWKAGCYPKGKEFWKWLAGKGWDEAEAIKTAAGDKGSKVHFAVNDLLEGKEIKMDSKYLNPSTGKEEELSLEEYDCILSFVNWYETEKDNIETINTEYVIINKKHNYAGTVDWKLKWKGVIWILDFKTGQYTWPEQEIQISAYRHAEPDVEKTGTLQLGYKRNKKGWKLNEIEDKFDLFLVASKIWDNEYGNVRPKQKDYPISLRLDIKEIVK